MDAPDQLAWLVWATASPYSPLNLHHLPQPIPNDAPLELQDGTFTFEDAFEDLLHVVSGRRLMDINSRYQMRKMLREMYPYGEDASFWVRRLHSQRLLDNSNFVPFSARPLWPQDVWDTIHREFARTARDAKKSDDPWFSFGSSDKEEQQDPKGRPRHSLFEDLDRLFRSLESHFPGKHKNDKNDKDSKDNKDNRDCKDSKNSDEGRDGEAENYDDLYSSLHSAFSTGAKSLNTFIKLARDGVSEIHKNGSLSSSTSTSWSSYGSANEDQKPHKVEEEKEEYTDEHGNHHIKSIIRTLDQDGHEIRREVRHRIQSSSSSSSSGNGDSQPRLETARRETNERDNTRDSKNGPDSNSGWFWK